MADKYGLNWNVWGDNPKKSNISSFDPSATIGTGWGEQPKNMPGGEDYVDPIQPQQPITCTLSNARFHPDDTTNFNQPCKVSVEVLGTPSGAIQFSLWAKYKGIEYDLHHTQNAYAQSGKAQAELELYYVDDFYTDFNQKGEVGAKVEYFAKVSNNAAREIKSELFTMPRAAPASKLIESYFADRHGRKITAVDHGDTVFLILETRGMIGHLIAIELENRDITYKCSRFAIMDSILKDFKITANTEKIKLKVV